MEPEPSAETCEEELMETLFDTANLAEIADMTPLYPLAGLTTNPMIIKAEGRVDFYDHFRKIREMIAPHRTLHIQVLAQDADGIIADAHRLLERGYARGAR
jgi:transaldolase